MPRVLAFTVIAAVVVLTAFIPLLPGKLLYLHLLRVPVLFVVLLVALPIVAARVVPGMLRNLFSYDSIRDLAIVTAFSVLASIAVGISAFTIVFGAQDRYQASPCIGDSIPGWAAAFLLVSVPTIVMTCLQSWELKLLPKIFAVIAGLVAALGATAIGYLLLRFDLFKDVVLLLLGGFNWISRDGFKAGYLSPDGALLPGHLAASAFLVVVVALYVVSYHLFKPTMRCFRWRPPALFFLFQIVIFLCVFFAGATFFLDRYRFPVLLSTIGLSAAIFVFFKTDHFFNLRPTANENSVPAPPVDIDGLRTALRRRLAMQPDGDRTLVVVCASGGGIQAAAWTTRVLTGLQQRYGGRFVRAIGLISSASGGSVGTLHYLDHFDLEEGCPPDHEFNAIFEQATHNSLAATGWGMAGPDFLKAAFLPRLIPKDRDRGWAIEERWRLSLRYGMTTLAKWRKCVLRGKMPCPIFNATVVETGDRLLVAPVPLRDALEATETEDFFTLYGDTDLDVVTAARLSATFPYVTPFCRPNPDHRPESEYHVADGGYFDNFGVFTAVQWIEKIVLDAPDHLGVNRIQVLEVNAFPEPDPDAKKDGTGWLHSVAGPIIALVNVRNSTQTARNDAELELLDGICGEEVTLERVSLRFTLQDDGARAFRGLGGTYQPPLSWKLTATEKNAVHEGWERLEGGSDLELLDKVWG
jgi:hypothetical protein